MTALATNRYDARYYQDLNAVAGKTYKVTITLRHVGTGSVTPDIVVEKNATPYTKYVDISLNGVGTDDVGLTSAANPAAITNTTWRTFTGQYTATASEQIRVSLMLGKVNQGVRVGTFSMTEE
jgi:YbbR domain-containing protein